MSKKFEGMTALVTGSSNGIGAEAAVKFAQHGARVLIHYRSSIDDATGVLARVHEAGSDGEIFHGDFRTSEGVHEFLKSVGDRPVDILVNNAGWLVQRTPFLDFTKELWNNVIMLNYTSVFLITQHFLPGMIERGKGFVVNVSSVAARNGGGIGAIAYASSKGGLSTMTKGLAKEFAPKGIRVNAVSPGTIDTNFHKTFSTEQMLNGVRAATPVGRLGDSAETADVILFLCSDEARFIHGQVLEVNGGFLMV
jgi:NAD(P)-dependent dehydrogenase (short-subunit alcohol dehydrogenase family)